MGSFFLERLTEEEFQLRAKAKSRPGAAASSLRV
jgi:hypothetical protein